MIVIVAQFNTDGDYSVDDENAGLVRCGDDYDGYDHCGTFLCNDAKEAEAVIMRIRDSVHSSMIDLDWFTETFSEALRVLRETPGILRFGWAKFLEGNYTGTHLFMQGITGEFVRVVRCRDCANAQESIHPRCFVCESFGHYGNENRVRCDDYCSYGERRTDKQTP